MAITFINKSRLENNLWVATNGAFSDNLLIDGFLTSGYLAANHNQYWVINGRNRHVDFAYAETIKTE